MKYRLQAFGLHLLGSTLALSLVVGGLYLGWYRWPGWYLANALHVVLLVLMVDLALGPTLTLIVASATKPRRVLARDVGIIVAVQLVALVYGGVTLWQGRPLYYAFSVDCVQMVQASDLSAAEIERARHENPALAPHWYSLPRWVWAPLPANKDEAARIALGAGIFGGADVTEMPRMFRSWHESVPAMRKELADVDTVWGLSRAERRELRSRMLELGFDPAQKNTLILWGSRRALVVVDLTTLNPRAVLKPG